MQVLVSPLKALMRLPRYVMASASFCAQNQPRKPNIMFSEFSPEMAPAPHDVTIDCIRKCGGVGADLYGKASIYEGAHPNRFLCCTRKNLCGMRSSRMKRESFSIANVFVSVYDEEFTEKWAYHG